MIERALAEAQRAGHRLVILVGDEPYYARAASSAFRAGGSKMPGPVDPARLLVAELADGAFEGVSGPVAAGLAEN